MLKYNEMICYIALLLLLNVYSVARCCCPLLLLPRLLISFRNNKECAAGPQLPDEKQDK